MKTCSKCHIAKDESEFSPGRCKLDGLAYWCRGCHREHCRLQRRARGEKVRAVVRTTTTKLCYKCKLWQPFDAFPKDSRTVDGRTAACRACHKIRKAKYVHTAQAIIVRRRRIAWRLKNDISYRLLDTIRKRIRQALGRTKKSKRSEELLGCTLDEFRCYLESKWLPGMSWDNHGIHGWHIDHIISCASFDLTDPVQQAQCFHYTNQRPLWSADNWRKGSKSDYAYNNTQAVSITEEESKNE